MELHEWLGWTVVLLIVWFFGMNFTYGVKLFPRERDIKGRIIKHWLHDIEALLWPAAWLVWASIWGFIWVGRAMRFLGDVLFHVGEKVGGVEPSTNPQVERRLRDISQTVRKP